MASARESDQVLPSARAARIHMAGKLRPTGLKMRRILDSGGGGLACEVDGKESEDKKVKLVCRRVTTVR